MFFNDRRKKKPTHKHNWYAVGGDNYGPVFNMCTEPGCKAEQHNEEQSPKKNGDILYKLTTYPNGKK